jgi:hypothetical protein
LVGRASHDIDHDGTLFMTGRDVQEDQLIGTLLLIPRSDFNRVAGITKLDEVSSFDDSASMDIQAGDNAFGEHS